MPELDAVSDKEKGTARMDSPFFPQECPVHMELEQHPNAGHFIKIS